MRQVFLLGEVVEGDRQEADKGELVPCLGVCSEAIAGKYVRAAEEVARTDAMTGLPNERAFNEDLAEVVDRMPQDLESFVLVLVDLDGLKVANDEFGGHAAGNHYIRRFAAQLLDSVRPRGGRVYRLHAKGDEFAAVFESITAEAVEEAIVELGAQADVAPFCFGIVNSPGDGTTSDELTTVADERLYEMKDQRTKEERQEDARKWLSSEHWDYEETG